ncbi:MAG: hypothetical protein HQ503_12460 [Rhodospirillales bacterium]|nr:hypothetical protein [Rhodospirillales bacterium]
MSKFPKIVLILIAVSVGVIVLWTAAPRAISELARLSTDLTWKNVIDGKRDIPLTRLEKLHANQKSFLGRRAAAQSYANLAVAEMALATAHRLQSAERASWLKAAEISAEQGLLGQPANSYAWTRLAYLRLINEGKTQRTSQALMMSVLNGPYEKRLVHDRITYGLLTWDKLTASDRSIMQNQIQFAERKNRAKLVEIVRRNKKYLTIVITALANDPDRMKDFFKAYYRKEFRKR